MQENTHQDPSALTIDALHREIATLDRIISLQLAAVSDRFTAMSTLLDERFATSTKALDAAFIAQQCVEASTPVLCADLVWRPAGELRVGDELVAFDDDSPDGAGRRLRESFVIANSLMPDELIRVTVNGVSVECNTAHPWLVRDRHNNGWKWKTTGKLSLGEEIMQPFDVWETDRSYEAGWLSGMLDGEGCLCFKNDTVNGAARLSVSQRVSDTAFRLEQSLKSLDISVGVRDRPAGKGIGPDGSTQFNRQASQVFEVNVRQDVLKVLGSVRPERLLVNSREVWEGRRLGRAGAPKLITSIEPVGVGTIASLSTSTGTYIAAGFAMHNTAMATALTAAKLAVDTAQAAADKAVDKAYLADSKRFESLSDKYNELQSRMDRSLGADSGETKVKTDRRLDSALVVSAVSVIVAIVAAVVAIFR